VPPLSTVLTVFAFLFNLCAVFVLSLMLPFGLAVNVWFKILLAFLITTGEVLACAAAIYVHEEHRPSRKVAKHPGNN
jgi:FtsH-binding integral membrane protein